jgi:hypothetical protein
MIKMGKKRNVSKASHRVTSLGVIKTSIMYSQIYANDAQVAVVINTKK